MPATGERRPFGQRRSTLSACILAPGRPRTFCFVRNITASGALLELMPPDWLPFQFELQIMGEPAPRLCQARQVLEHGVGVNFCQRPAPQKAPPENTAIDDIESWCGTGKSAAPPPAHPRRLT